MSVRHLALAGLALVSLGSTGSAKDPAAELRAWLGGDVPELLADPRIRTDRSPGGFYVLLRRKAGVSRVDSAENVYPGAALVDTTGHVYWVRREPVVGDAFLSRDGLVVLAGFGLWKSSNRPENPNYRYRVIVRRLDGGFSRSIWESSGMPETEYWPRRERPLDEELHLITGLSPGHVFVFTYVDPYRNDRSVRGIVLDENLTWSVHLDFQPREFAFEGDEILVRGTAFFSDSTVVVRLDRNGRSVD